jgi:UDP-glucose 4-epimerase
MEGIHPRVPSGEPGHRQLLGDGVIHLDDVCLVTGGAGFIGANLVHALLRQGMRVRVFDDLSTGDAANLADLGDRVELVRGDVRDEEMVRAAAQGAAVVYHLAAMTSEAASVADPLAAHAINTSGTLHVLLGARDAGCQRVVVASSAEVYGDQDTAALSEELPAWPMTPFAASQLAAERYATAFFYAYALPVVSLRFFNVYGPRERIDGEGGVVASFVRAVLDGRPMAIEGDGEQTRDFVHVGDAVQALLLASDATPDAFGGVFNVGVGDRHSIGQLATTLAGLAVELGLGSVSAPVHVAARADDRPRRQADVREAERVLGFSPEYGFEEGLRRTLQWFAERDASGSVVPPPPGAR